MNAGKDTPVSISSVTYNHTLGGDVNCGCYSSGFSCISVTRTISGHSLISMYLACQWLPDHSPGQAQYIPPKIDTELMSFYSHSDWIYLSPGIYDYTLLWNYLT